MQYYKSSSQSSFGDNIVNLLTTSPNSYGIGGLSRAFEHDYARQNGQTDNFDGRTLFNLPNSLVPTWFPSSTIYGFAIFEFSNIYEKTKLSYMPWYYDRVFLAESFIHNHFRYLGESFNYNVRPMNGMATFIYIQTYNDLSALKMIYFKTWNHRTSGQWRVDQRSSGMDISDILRLKSTPPPKLPCSRFFATSQKLFKNDHMDVKIMNDMDEIFKEGMPRHLLVCVNSQQPQRLETVMQNLGITIQEIYQIYWGRVNVNIRVLIFAFVDTRDTLKLKASALSLYHAKLLSLDNFYRSLKYGHYTRDTSYGLIGPSLNIDNFGFLLLTVTIYRHSPHFHYSNDFDYFCESSSILFHVKILLNGAGTSVSLFLLSSTVLNEWKIILQFSNVFDCQNAFPTLNGKNIYNVGIIRASFPSAIGICPTGTSSKQSVCSLPDFPLASLYATAKNTYKCDICSLEHPLSDGSVSAGPSVNNSPSHPSSSLTNEILPWRVEQGLDSRMTCMLRNIPNKYTQSMLVDFINETHKGLYDFFYLRMDFKNRCNVGYAFINFIEPKYIICFSKRVKGLKWAHFRTSKVCDLTYANIQGKDSLIRKFRNSSVMTAEPSYRPKIFYSDGPLRGLEQEFPSPDRPRAITNLSPDQFNL